MSKFGKGQESANSGHWSRWLKAVIPASFSEICEILKVQMDMVIPFLRVFLFLLLEAVFASGFALAQSTSAMCADSLLTFFDVEGDSPFIDNELHFSALRSKALTENGHGLRNELKKKEKLRRPMYQTSETISGRVTFTLPPGAKTIFVQYHGGDTHTLVKLFIADIQNRHLINGQANDGIFDLYVSESDASGKETLFSMGTARSGDSFVFRLSNRNGFVTVSMAANTVEFKTKDSPGTYLKFGDYLQAQDPVTDKQEPHDSISDFYQRHHISQDELVIRNLVYSGSNSISTTIV